MLADHVDAFRSVLHDDVEDPLFPLIDLPPHESNCVWVVEVPFNLLKSWQSRQRNQLHHSLLLAVGLQNQEELLRDDHETGMKSTYMST